METMETLRDICKSNISRKQKEILELIDTYRYMTPSQIRRKIWGQDNRNSQIQYSKHFSQMKVENLKKKGLLKENNEVFSTNARGAGSLHQQIIVDTLLNLEAKANILGFGFTFTYDPVYEKLRPDATVLFTDQNRCLLCYIEVHLESQNEEILYEKFDNYSELARGNKFENRWTKYAACFHLHIPKEYAFKVFVFSKKKRVFPHPRLVSIVLGQEIPEGVF